MKLKILQFYSFFKQFFIWKSLRKKVINLDFSNEGPIIIVPCDPETVGGSRGDEAMILASINYYRVKDHNIKFYIIVSDNKGIDYVNKLNIHNIFPIASWNGNYPLKKVYTSIVKKKPKEVVILGADCMDGFYSPYLSLMLLSLYDLLIATNIKSHLLGFSFNNSPSKLMVTAFKSLPNNLPIRLRDSISKKRFDNIIKRKSELVADAAFLLEPDKDCVGYLNLKKWLEQKYINAKIIIGFNFHPMLKKYHNKNEIEHDAIKIAINLEKCLCTNKNILLVLIPHDDRKRLSDNIVLSTIFNYLSSKGYLDRLYYDKTVYRASHIKSICSLLDCLISSRMHLAIACLSQCIPVMAATYQGKFEGLYNHFDIDKKLLLEPDIFVSDDFSNVFNFFIENLANIRLNLYSNIEKIKDLSKQNYL